MCVKRIALLGCTGSIGTTALNVIRKYKNEYKLVLIANNNNIEGLKRISSEFKPDIVFSNSGYLYINNIEKPFDKEFLSRPETYKNVDIVINGIVGLAGLAPTIATLKAGKILATANKESLVCAGNLINLNLKNYKGEIRPIDSEHSTIWQCIGNNKNNVESLILTASGGAFRNLNKNELVAAKASQALKHPNWVMGKKVTIDCATLVNKGMEIIEAKHLFGINNIKTIQHNESIIHSLVGMKDGTLIAGLSNPDMEIPIQYALTYPERKQTSIKKLKLEELGQLNFGKLDEDKFPCLSICKKVSKYGDYAGTILNAADEVAVEMYLKDKIGFYEISDFINSAFHKFGFEGNINHIDDIYGIDKEVKEYILRSF